MLYLLPYSPLLLSQILPMKVTGKLYKLQLVCPFLLYRARRYRHSWIGLCSPRSMTTPTLMACPPRSGGPYTPIQGRLPSRPSSLLVLITASLAHDRSCPDGTAPHSPP